MGAGRPEPLGHAARGRSGHQVPQGEGLLQQHPHFFDVLAVSRVVRALKRAALPPGVVSKAGASGSTLLPSGAPCGAVATPRWPSPVEDVTEIVNSFRFHVVLQKVR